MADQIRRTQPGIPRRVDDNAMPRGTVPLDKTPRVPPNDAPRSHIRPTLSPPPASAAVEERTPTSAAGGVLDSTYERVGLPSRFAFYAWQDCSVRLIEPVDHAKVTRACRHRNLSLMLDVMSSTSNRDAREFAISDFYSLCQWHKANSYPPSPTTVTWNSRYGGRVSEKVRKSQLEETPLARSRQEYLEWVGRGLASPTMRDLELLETIKDEDTSTLFQRAQFISLEPLQDRVRELRRAGDTAPTVTARVEELQRRGMKFYDEIDQFSDQFAEFGVTEWVEPVNTKWDPKAFVAFVLDPENQVTDEDLIQEAHEIRDVLDSNGTPLPRKERVPLTFNLWGMFPYV